MLREQQDRYLPIANVSRIMKMALPSQHGKVELALRVVVPWSSGSPRAATAEVGCGPRADSSASPQIARDAKECVQEAVSEFVSFITSEASDRCLSEKRKTITSDDIIVAMQTLGFDNYIEPLRQYIANYRYVSTRVAVCLLFFRLPCWPTLLPPEKEC